MNRETVRQNKEMKYLKYVIPIMYIVSWFLPLGLEDYMGYDGAAVAFEVFMEGFEDLGKAILGTEDFSLSDVMNSIAGIIVGSVNFLFIVSYLLLLKRSKYSISFGSTSLVLMISWGISYEVYFGLGYSLWVLSGILLLFISVKNTRHITLSNLFKSSLLIPCYLTAIFIWGALLS